GCEKLTQINLPDSVTEVGAAAFKDCINLSQVTLSKKLETLGAGVFRDCDSLRAIEIPKSLKSTTSSVTHGGPFSYCDGLKEVTFEKGTTKIASCLFSRCTGIEEIKIPDTVTVIEDNAFYKCSNLAKADIAASVTEIQSYAFEGCEKLTQINLPDSVTEVGNRVFYGCIDLPEIVFPDSIKNIGNDFFSGCSSLQKVTLPNTIIEIPRNTFKDCTSLEKVNFPETLEAIRSYAFYNTNLPEADLPKNLTTIENYAFYNCDALTKVVIPDSVTELGTYVFADCEQLSDVSLGTGITKIPSYAFNLCPSLQKIILPYRTTTISSNAFTNCTALTEITIPRSVTSIASGVFSYPSRLTIYGIAGTYAETYANSIGAAFVSRETNATEVKLDKTDLKLVRGKKAALHLSITPSDFTDRVTWKSTDDSIVSVEDSGVVTAKAIGTATVKVTVGDLSASCKVTVTQPVTSISLNKTSLSMDAWATEKLTATASPSTAENKAVTWSSSDNKVASVDDTGLVTANTKGSATITATAQDGSGVYRNCAVTVLNNGYLCTSTAELESPHNYSVNCSDFWLYTKEGAESLYITFDTRTKVEEDFDFLYIYDGKEKQIGKYTGTQLAGQTVEVPGDTVKIKLVSDEEGTAWGFKVTYIMGTGDVENDEYLVTFDSQGGSAVSAVQVEKGTTVSKPTDPVRSGYEFAGWYLDEKPYDFSHPVTKNMVLRARWKYIVPEPDPTETEPVPAEDLPENGNIPSGLWIAGVKDQVYTGKAIKPEVRVYDGSRRLTEKADYTISYKNHTKANDASDVKKAPTIIVKGKGNYAGSATATFRIDPIDINADSVSVVLDTLAYNQKVQKKAPTVTFAGKKLSLNRDYTVTYTASESDAYQEVGIYPIQITGIGNFTGTKTLNLEITDKTLISKAKVVKVPDQTYNNGEEIRLSQAELVLYMKSKAEPLVERTDYSVRYENNCEIGTATAVVTGMGDYAGTKRVSFKIKGKAINKAVVTGIENKIYNGTEQQQNITVTVDYSVLTQDKDYTVSYKKNKDAGTAQLVIQGIGAYSGTLKKSFKIAAYDLGVDEKGLISELQINQGTVAGSDEGLTMVYTQGGCQPDVTLRFGEVELVKGKDYTISYQNNKNIADRTAQKAPTIVIKGKGNFKGKLSEKFTIVKRSLDDAAYPVAMSVADVAYTKGAGKYISKPTLTDINGKKLKAGTDYDASYMAADGITKLNKKSVVNAGSYVCVTVRGKGKYDGSLMTTYRITQANFAKVSVKIAPQTYTGNRVFINDENRGDITVKIGKTELVCGVDYEIMEDSYANNIKKGNASVTLRGINDYGGMKTVKFKIQAKKMESFSSIVRGMLGESSSILGW
ncbi:MAG: leucine-rich repeat protein, partial [Eubacterium sp.]|nr:leucine-rich repeat protein [Eubacterium sp.]